MTRRKRKFLEWLPAMAAWFAFFVLLGAVVARHV
jgi:hypothetical protein